MEISLLQDDEQIIKVPFLDANVHLVYVPSDEITAIVKRATDKSWDRKHQPTDEFNVITYRKLLGRKAVKGWEGLTLKGQTFEYTPENCDLLMSKWSDFALFVGNACSDLQALNEAERRELEKK